MNTEKRYQCRHIFTAGHRCGSPALRNQDFCYYHHTTRKPAPKNRPLAPFEFELPIPEDRAAIQQAIGQILQRIASNQIDPRRAGLLLYGLQIAASILPKPQKPAKSTRSSEPEYLEPQFVDEIIDHPDHGPLAPQSLMPNSEDLRPKSLAGELLKVLRGEPSSLDFKDPYEDDNEYNENNGQRTDPATIPTLNACAHTGPDLTPINRRVCQKIRGRGTNIRPFCTAIHEPGVLPSYTFNAKTTLTMPSVLSENAKILSPQR
jgi:hypothetical protein